jgi:hypothetical protein
MINKANIMDEYGLYKEADNIDKFVIFASFNLKKKPKNILTKIDDVKRSVDYLQSLITGLGESSDSSDSGETKVDVSVEGKPVEFQVA